MIHFFKEASELVFPNICMACQEQRAHKPNLFCSECILQIPYTDHFVNQCNTLGQHFLGRITIEHCASLVYFSEHAIVQKMMHRLKYERQSQIATSFGRIVGQKMKDSIYFQNIDALVPVPMHYKKKAHRGYNQSEVFANGIADETGLYVASENLIKYRETDSQTKKNRTDRQLNLKECMKIRRPGFFKEKHIALIDDIVTTGATMEACALLLMECGIKKLSLISIAEATW
jgi:ComF family protein